LYEEWAGNNPDAAKKPDQGPDPPRYKGPSFQAADADEVKDNNGDEADTPSVVMTPLPSPTVLVQQQPPAAPGLEGQGGEEKQKEEEQTASSQSENSTSSAESSPDNITPPPSPTGSNTPEVDDGLLQYLLHYINRQVPNCPRTPNLLGEVSWEEPKTAKSSTWHLTYDVSVRPQRRNFAKQMNLDLDSVTSKYYCVGAELVSSVLNFDHQTTWFPMLQQLDADFKFDGQHGAWFNEEPNLHVHFGILGQELQLETAKNLLALYGLFEREIEGWLMREQRDNWTWCPSVRGGMEYDIHAFRGTGALENRTVYVQQEGRRFTPIEFTNRIYGMKTMEELKTEMCGFPPSGDWGDGIPRTVGGYREWVAVNLSVQRANKPATIEFRHHHGTIDPVEIKWWVSFCGQLLRYSHHLAQTGFCINDAGRFRHEDFSFVENITENSILDLLAFPEEGKSHFKAQTDRFRDEIHAETRALQDLVVKERSRLRKLGKRSGAVMDRHIYNEDWYKEAKKNLDAHYVAR